MTRTILFFTLLASAVLPLVVVKGLAFPFAAPRELFLRVIVALALPVAVLVATRAGVGRPRWLCWATLACVIVALAGLPFSVDPWTSFWGFVERQVGAFTILAVAAYAGMLALLFREARHRRWFFLAWLGVWAAVAVWALLEQVIPGFWAEFNGGGGRSVATIGNSIFLADALILVAGTALTASWLASDVRLRWAGAGYALVCVLAILATETRGAFLGLGVGVLVAAAAAALWHTGKKVRGAAIGAVVVIVLGVAGLFLLRDNAAVQSLPVIGRTVSAFSSQDTSRSQRFDMWRIAAEGIRARPLTGWGLENFDTVLDRLYDPSFTRFDVAQSYSDRAHNAYLDAAVAGGLPLLAAYLFLLAAFVVVIVRARRAGRLTPIAAAAALGTVAAYAAANVTAFETPTTMLALAVCGALLASLEPRRASGMMRLPSWTAVPVALLSLAIIFAAVVPLARGLVLVHAVAVTEDMQVKIDAARDIRTFWNPYRAHMEQRIGNDIFKKVGAASPITDLHRAALREAEAVLRDAVTIRPHHFAQRFTLANVLLLRAMHETDDFDAALAAFEEARPLAPDRQLVDYQIGNLWLVRKDPQRAITSFERALALDASVPESHWHLARGLATAGDTAAAAREFRTAWDGGFRGLRPDDEYALAINAALAVNDLPLVRDIAAHRAAAEPEDPDRWAALAAVEAALGHREAAAAALREAVRIDPTLRTEAEQFIQEYGLPPDTLNP